MSERIVSPSWIDDFRTRLVSWHKYSCCRHRHTNAGGVRNVKRCEAFCPVECFRTLAKRSIGRPVHLHSLFDNWGVRQMRDRTNELELGSPSNGFIMASPTVTAETPLAAVVMSAQSKETSSPVTDQPQMDDVSCPHFRRALVSPLHR